ncbi:MAG: ABC transporter ATP-binding protein [Mycoplasmataceae bacterium]|nr:ABC transporter ATP-binding protein [Mycoplasmataceae bacterium]
MKDIKDIKDKFLKNFLKEKSTSDNLHSDSQIIKIDYKLKRQLNKANNTKRKSDEHANKINEVGNIIDIKNLNKYYISGGNTTRVLTDLTLSIKTGDFVILYGKSGSGKTTLLNLMSGLDRPTSGDLIVSNQNLPYLSNMQLTTFRRNKLAFIFQSYNLLNNLSGFDNVETGLYLQKDKSKQQDIKKMFEDFDLIDVIDKYPSQMSGGQQQRISILRALAKNSEIIFADEPTGALDKKTGTIVMELLRKINMELGKTIIMVSHDPELIKYSTRVIKLSNSKIVQDETNK